MITSSTMSRFTPTILGSVTRLSTNVTYEFFFLLENVLPLSSTLPRSVAKLSVVDRQDSSADFATSSRSAASLLSRRNVDKSAGLESRNCSFTNKSL